MKFYCTPETATVMSGFQEESETTEEEQLFHSLFDERTEFKCGQQDFAIECIPTGKVTQSVMFIIYIGVK